MITIDAFRGDDLKSFPLKVLEELFREDALLVLCGLIHEEMYGKIDAKGK